MSAVIASSVEYPPPGQTDDNASIELENEVEEPVWEPRHIHLPRILVGAILSFFVLVVIVACIWGLAQSTLTYGMIPVDSATTARLARVQRDLAFAGVPESALRHLVAAARPGINIGDAIEALVDADRDLEAWSKNPAVASARAELRSTLYQLSRKRYGGTEGTSVMLTPLPTLTLPGQ